MYNPAFLAALLAATASGAPLSVRQLDGGDSSTSGLGGLLGGLGGLGGSATGTDSLPTALPTGLLGGLGGLGGSGTGTESLPTALPTGLLGGLTGSAPTALPTGLLGGLTGSDSGSGTGLAGILGQLGSSSSRAIKKRQSSLGGLLGGTGTTSSSGALSSLLSGFGGTGTTSSDSGIASLLSGLGGSTTSSGTAAASTDTSSTSGTSSGLSGLLGGGSSTQNGLSGACEAVTVIFARGTTETGNMGTVVGPGLSTDLETDLSGKVAIQGVDYAADAAGITSEALGPGTGSEAMIADVEEAIKNCPDTQIVLSGYSQGAMLVHNTMGALTTAQAASVKAAVTFGDPFVGTAIKNLDSANWKSFCATGDPVCESGAAASPASGGTTSASTASHLGYGADVQTASTWIKGKVTV